MNKLYLIIITHALHMSIGDVEGKIGINNLKVSATKDVISAQLIDSGICIGKFEDKILIVSPEKVPDFFLNDISVFEQEICTLFPKSEIVALNLNSSVDMYGYAIFRDGKKVRAKWASGTDVYINMGSIIKEEEDLDDDGDMGSLVVERLLKKYLGENYSSIKLMQYR